MSEIQQSHRHFASQFLQQQSIENNNIFASLARIFVGDYKFFTSKTRQIVKNCNGELESSDRTITHVTMIQLHREQCVFLKVLRH